MVPKALVGAILVTLYVHTAAAGMVQPTYSQPWVNSCTHGYYKCKWPPTNWRPPRPSKPNTGGCPPGYGYQSQGIDGKPQCTPCESGTYSRGGTSICLKCGTGSGYATPQKASSADACVCYAGYGGVSCTMCQPGTYSPGVHRMTSGRSGRNFDPRPPCRVCPQNTLGSSKPGAASIEECGGCVPGTGGPKCTTCPPGTWSSGGSFDECTPCGPNQTSWPGAEGPSLCMCKAGTGDDGDGNCDTCPEGTYWPGPPAPPASQDSTTAEAHAAASAASPKPYILPCMSCPTNTTSAPGSTSINDCMKM